MSLTVEIDMTEANADHPTAGRRRRHKSPPTLHAPIALPVPRLDDHVDTENGPSDEEGKKEAKRQRSEPTTPISPSSRLPYEYDRMMGITQVGSGETEGFDEGTDLVYHDAAEDPNVLESGDTTLETVLSHGGCGSSTLRECIALLNDPLRKSPATCHSGANMENRSGPPQFMSPNVKESQQTAEQGAPDLMSGNVPTIKEEPQVQMQRTKSEASTPKLESPMTDVKEEVDEFDTPGQGPDALPEDVLGVAKNQPSDSEDSLSPDHVASELRRLNEARTSASFAELRERELRARVASDPDQSQEEGAVAPGAEESTAPVITQNRQGAVAPDSDENRENNETYAPHRTERFRGRLRSPDPYLFSSTIWIRHDPEASARMHENPVDCLRDRVVAMEHNLDTLRTRVTQVADLRDAQGIREDHRAIIARLNEVTRSMDDFYAGIRTQDWYHDISDQEEDEEMENQSGLENRSSGRRRLRGHAPHRRALRQWTRSMPRPPPPENDAMTPQNVGRTPENSTEQTQQAMQRLLAAYNQCMRWG